MMKHVFWNATLWNATLITITSVSLWSMGRVTNAAPSVEKGANLSQSSVVTQSVTKQADEQTDDTPGAWVPVDRIDPSRPAAIILINDTAIPLEYAFSTTEMRPQTLEPGDTVTLRNVPVPSTLLVNAHTPAAVLDYAFGSVGDESEPDNTATVTISLVNQQFNAAGFSAIDIHETGALYRY